MGRDKAQLEIGNQPLVEHAAELIRALGLVPRICGSRPDLARFAKVVPDNFPGCGPLAGIEAALTVSGAELNLFVPVDMPGIPREFLRWMASRAEVSRAVATVPRFGNRSQPLCAVYSQRLLEGLRKQLTDGNLKIMAAIPAAAASLREPVDLFQVESVAAALAIGEWPSSLPMVNWFRNVNTPADYERLRAYRAWLEQKALIQ